MAHKPPEPEGTTRGRGLFMAINPCLLWFICYIRHSANWSLLLLVKLIHMVVFTVNKACKLIYTLNKVVYKKHHFTTSCGIIMEQNPQNLQLPVSIWKLYHG